MCLKSAKYSLLIKSASGLFFAHTNKLRVVLHLKTNNTVERGSLTRDYFMPHKIRLQHPQVKFWILSIKSWDMSWWDGWASSGAHDQFWVPKLDPQNPHSERRQGTLNSGLLTSTHGLWALRAYMCVCVYTHITNNHITWVSVLHFLFCKHLYTIISSKLFNILQKCF